MAKTKRYTISDGKLVLTLKVADEGGYIVTSPLYPDVLTQAETIEEAFENARDVIALFKADRANTKKTRTSPVSKARDHALPLKGAKPRAKLAALKPVQKKRPVTQQVSPV
ncbi:type II toxin-antitoxin system HicB family antitoxin [Gemmata sp. G18]|uniref:Type II toxin-antitoxin system HicB family antitoxin n=1 Tax=Gemmata palustris TaxID=2822762 RepID=A0ABS5BYI8_9BACT|nr:type II toxin-antitoxin system HicB family antitoxin [Gemmata palustris]MBP3958725.1 type II toxin-antitoxin system HicB family antitoxin [Gemmata palustris]